VSESDAEQHRARVEHGGNENASRNRLAPAQARRADQVRNRQNEYERGVQQRHFERNGQR
jgi:hypothetical protein